MSLWKRMLGRKMSQKKEPQFVKRDNVQAYEASNDTGHRKQEEFQDNLTQSIHARWEYWGKVGVLASELIAPQVNPIYKNVPAWPSNRLAFLTIEREESTILATDGLSDPFEGVRGGRQGYGAELFIEIAEQPLTEASRNIAIDILMSLSYNVVARGGIDDLLEEYGIFSIEIPESDLPNSHLTQDGSACVLMGGPQADFSPLNVDGPSNMIEFISITLLTGREAALVRQYGASARADIAQNLLESGIGNLSVIGRPSIIE